MMVNLQNLKADEKLIEKLQASTSRKLTEDEKFEQRVSFVYSSMDLDSAITKQEIREALMKNY